MDFYYKIGPVKVRSNIQLSERRCRVPHIDENELDLSIYVLNTPKLKMLFQKYDKELKIGTGEIIYYVPADKALLYRNRLLGRDILMILREVEGKTEFYASKSLIETVKLPLPMIDLPRFGDMVFSLINVKSIQKQYAWIHAALVDSPYGGLAISAYPNTGKTTTAVLLGMKNGFIALDDDMPFINSIGEGYGLSFSNIPIWITAEQRLLSKAKVRLIKFRSIVSAALRYLWYVPYAPNLLLDMSERIANVPLKNQLRTKISSGKTVVDYLFILERGNKEVVPLDCEEAGRKLLMICKREHYALDNNYLLLSYSYFSNEFRFSEILRKRDEIILNFAKRVKSYVIRAKSPLDYADLILNTIK